jgi:hypothetical protein
MLEIHLDAMVTGVDQRRVDSNSKHPGLSLIARLLWPVRLGVPPSHAMFPIRRRAGRPHGGLRRDLMARVPPVPAPVAEGVMKYPVLVASPVATPFV